MGERRGSAWRRGPERGRKWTVTSGSPDYLQAVEAHFVALRGKGYALSGRDVGRVLAWQAEGVPLRVVLQALDDEARRRGPGLTRGSRPLTLGSFARTVRERSESWAARRVSVEDGPGAPPADRFELLRRALAARATDEQVTPLLRQAEQRLQALQVAGVDAWAAATELDAMLASELERLLDADARGEIARRVEARIDRRASAQAQAEKAAFETARELRERFAVPELVQVLLDAG